MPSLDVIFAYVVGVLAAIAVIGALVYAVVWEWCAIRRTVAEHRRRAQGDPSVRYWREHSAVAVPERRS